MSKLTKALLPQVRTCRDPWGLGFIVRIRRSGHSKANVNAAQTARDRVTLARAIGAAKERRKSRPSPAEEKAAREPRETAAEEAPAEGVQPSVRNETLDLARLAVEDTTFAAELGQIIATSKDFSVCSFIAGWANDPEAEEPFFKEHQLPKGGAFSRQDVTERFLSAFGDEDDEEVPHLPPFMSAEGEFVDDLETMKKASEIVVAYLGAVAAVLSPPKEGEEEPPAVDDAREKAEALAKERDEKLMALGVVRTPYAGQALREAVLNWIADTADEIQAEHDAAKVFLPHPSKPNKGFGGGSSKPSET